MKQTAVPGAPLTRAQHLLWKLAEEAAEIVQEASKASIFGLLEVKPGITAPNAERVLLELLDLAAVSQMLTDEGILPLPTPEEAARHFAAKKEKVEKYIEYARSIGMLRE